MKLEVKSIPGHSKRDAASNPGADRARVLQTLLADRIPRSRPSSLYVHVPFCFHKCHYCDFYSVVDSQNRQEPYLCRLIQDIRTLSAFDVGAMDTVFVGGGTPSLLAPGLWTRLLDELSGWLKPAGGTEFTVEANPETVTAELAGVLAGGGVNRVSIGAQSFNESSLKTLERWHAVDSVARAVEVFRNAGIANINLDLIYGIPGQSIDDWRRDLARALDLQPVHLSCYSLTYEPGTAMTARLHAGQFERIDDDVEASMFELTRLVLDEAGHAPYEVSNFARPDFQCRHNLVYWRGGDYLAAGPGAAGHVSGVRWKNEPHLGAYLESKEHVPLAEVEELDLALQLAERLMLGLRLMEGIDAAQLDAEARAIDDVTATRLGRALHEQQSRDHIEQRHSRWVLTHRGLMLGDTVVRELMGALRGEVRVHG